MADVSVDVAVAGVTHRAKEGPAAVVVGPSGATLAELAAAIAPPQTIAPAVPEMDPETFAAQGGHGAARAGDGPALRVLDAASRRHLGVPVVAGPQRPPATAGAARIARALVHVKIVEAVVPVAKIAEHLALEPQEGAPALDEGAVGRQRRGGHRDQQEVDVWPGGVVDEGVAEESVVPSHGLVEVEVDVQLVHLEPQGVVDGHV